LTSKARVNRGSDFHHDDTAVADVIGSAKPLGMRVVYAAPPRNEALKTRLARPVEGKCLVY
jgi:hypothetical protein